MQVLIVRLLSFGSEIGISLIVLALKQNKTNFNQIDKTFIWETGESGDTHAIVS